MNKLIKVFRSFLNPEKELKASLLLLIEKAKIIGLKNQYLVDASEFLAYHEYGLCFDTLIEQIYEESIEIDETFFELVCKVREKLQLPAENYDYLRKCVRTKSDISKAI